MEADMVVLAAAIEPDKSVRAGHHADRQHGHQRLLHRGPSQAAPRGEPDGRRVPLRRVPGPQGHPETVSQAGAAAAKVIGLLAKDKLTCNPCVARSDEWMCNGCSACEKVCPYGAITYVDKGVPHARPHGGRPAVAQVNPRCARAAARAP